MRFNPKRTGVALAASATLLAAAAAVTFTAPGAMAAPLRSSTPAADAGGAPPSSFHGVNWAAPGDNYASGPVVPSGLSTSDSYATVYSITKDVVAGFRHNLHANTLRLPVNPASVGASSTWWKSYRAVIDAATQSGFKVILSYWDQQPSNDGKIDNMAAWNQMWATLTSTYARNPLVYFEPMNEPYGYSDSQWVQICTTWLADYGYIPRGRVVISGTGYNDHVTAVGSAPALDGTLLSLHFYGYWANYTTESAWLADLLPRIGQYSNRLIIDEAGAFMTTGLNYAQGNGNQYTSYFDMITTYARQHHVGLVYWPGLRTGDEYSMETLEPNGTLVNNNPSGVAQLEWGYGLGSGAVAVAAAG